MERIDVRELGLNASRYLDLVKVGGTVEVTENGDPVALLVPAPCGDSPRDRLVTELIPASAPSGRTRSANPLPSGASEPANAELLDAERQERL
jgi:antitoxin (DNA-binding transcriptional repressor) of toxin-antitoxin stability system